MNEDLTPDEIRAALRDFFSDGASLAEVRRLRDAVGGSDDELATVGFDRARWQRLAVQLGLIEMGAPEHLGGLGLGFRHLTAAVEECAVGLTPGPVPATILVSSMLGALPSEAWGTCVHSVVQDFLAGAAVPGTSLSARVETAPEYVAGAVTGRIAPVSHGAVADLVLCPVRTSNGLALALVCLDPSRTTRSALVTVDPSKPVADLVVAQVPAVTLTVPGDEAALERCSTIARTVHAAEQVGGAEGCLAGMVGYAKVREQFDQLIGSYQAIQHHCARTATAIGAARALVSAAAGALDTGQANAARQHGLLAGAEAAECSNVAADTYIQVSGGVGFTWEHDAHLYFRRARSSAAFGSTPDQLRQRAVEVGCLDLVLTNAS